MISLSLLSTAHPNLFQQIPVRASSGNYPTFTLAMDRSPGFGSAPNDSTPTSDSVSLRLPYTVNLAAESNSLTHYTKGTPSLRASNTLAHARARGTIHKPERARHSSCPLPSVLSQAPKALEARSSDCLYAHGFRFYFTPLIGVLFTFPSRYWFTIGRQGVFSLGGWAPHLQPG